MIYGEITVGQQLGTFGLAALLGGIICTAYDLLRAWRRAARTARWAINLQDALFFALAAVAIYCLCLVRCQGRVRLFVPAGVAVGFAVTRFLLSDLVFGAAAAVMGFTRRLLGAVLRPMDKFVRAAIPAAAKKINIIAKKVKNILKRAKALVYNKRVSRTNKRSSRRKSRETDDATP